MKLNIQEILDKRNAGKPFTIDEQMILMGLGVSLLELHELVGRLFIEGDTPEDTAEEVNAGGYL